MYNTKFFLTGAQEIYPGYLDKERRELMKEQFGNKKQYMWCGCRADQKLYYRISEDLKIYPEHKNYEHDKCCSRYKSVTGDMERQTAYVINDEDGQITTYLTFNPKNFNMSNDSEKEQDNPDTFEDELISAEDEVIIEKEKEYIEKTEKKEPKLSLSSLVRCINIDTFTEKSLNNRNIESRELFSKYVYYRMKKIKISRMKKAIGDLTLEADGVRFVYFSLKDIVQKKDKGLAKCYIQSIGPDGKIFNSLIFPDTLAKALREFAKTYKIEPNEDTMIAGFQYYKKSRSKSMYKVLGRIHLFQVSTIGIYCRNLIEKVTYDTLYKLTQQDSNLKFWIPPEDETTGGIIQINNKKIMLLFRGKKDERFSFDTTTYEPLVVGENEPISREILYKIAEYSDLIYTE